jgi:hypothetical protein
MYDLEKLNKLEREYSVLLKQLPGGELMDYIFRMQGTPIDEIPNKISLLERKIPELKKTLNSLGIKISEDLGN